MEKSIKICSGSIPLPQKFPGKRNAALSYGADYGIILYHKITLPVYGSGNLVRKHMKHGLIVFLVSMVPLIELRGAIPAGIAAGLDPWLACGAAIFGNLLPVPFIILLVRQVFDRLRKHAFFAPKIDALERRAHLKGRLVRKYRLLGLMLFVAIPLPGTGAWTGALIAAFLNIRLRHALPAITLGLLIAGSLVTLMTLGLIHLL